MFIVKFLFVSFLNISYALGFCVNVMSSLNINRISKRDYLRKRMGGNSNKTVVKFGGSSIKSEKEIKSIGKILKHMIYHGGEPVVVCSALGNTTSTILELAKDCENKESIGIEALRDSHLDICEKLDIDIYTKQQVMSLLDNMETLLNGVSILGELSDKNKDKIVSIGERMSVRIISSFLKTIGINSNYFDPGSIGLITTDEFGNADILDQSYPGIYETMSNLNSDMVPVITGFLGETECGDITTLGRGGSDLSATIIGAAIGAKEVQLWKDVDGMMSMDPRIVPTAVSIPYVSYEQASELAYFGGNILHPISMRPLIGTSIPIRIKNSYNPSHPGTLITSDKSKSTNLVTAITFKRGIDLIDIVSTRMLGQSGFLSSVFSKFFKYSLSIDMIATSDVSISLTLDKNQDRNKINNCIQELDDISDVTCHRDRASISIISDMSLSSEMMAGVFSVLKKEGVKVYMISQGASKVNTGIVVSLEQLDVSIRALHRHFFENKY
jgi:aspartate kinase